MNSRVAVGSKGCIWAAAAATWTVTVHMRAVTALVWDVLAVWAEKGIIGAAWKKILQFTRSARKKHSSVR